MLTFGSERDSARDDNRDERTGAGSSCRALMTVLTDLDLF